MVEMSGRLGFGVRADEPVPRVAVKILVAPTFHIKGRPPRAVVMIAGVWRLGVGWIMS